MPFADNPRAFSERRHREGAWRTRSSLVRPGVLRALWCFLSLKRAGVDRLARNSAAGKRILDLGCGSGAYSRWLAGRSDAAVVAADWSWEAVRTITRPPGKKILPICADIRALPFKTDSFSAAFSVDVLGHVERVETVLGQLRRVTKAGAPLFLHSECSDYQDRWPDRELIHRNGNDVLAELDGHTGIQKSSVFRDAVERHFAVGRFFSPAGLLGWFLGYPEKYTQAFSQAGMMKWARITSVMAWCKRNPILGIAVRFINACTNHIELSIGLQGGGSCFADAVRYEKTTTRRGSPDTADGSRDG
jgi:SAM-dependent methyltransferase